MSTALINPGVCGMTCKVTVKKNDRNSVKVILDTKCPHVKKMEEELESIEGMNECFSKISTSKVYELANKHLKHTACPIPSGIIKAIEVECGLALPRDVEMKISKNN